MHVLLGFEAFSILLSYVFLNRPILTAACLEWCTPFMLTPLAGELFAETVVTLAPGPKLLLTAALCEPQELQLAHLSWLDV